MKTVKKLLAGIEKRFIVATVASPVTMILEVFMETIIPLFMARIIDIGIASRDMNYVLKTGALMVLFSVLSLCAGALGGVFSAFAAQGFSHNLRKNLFRKVQDFSFSNIDKFTTASLITRLTVDVSSVENIYRLVIRICIRAPFMLFSGTFMACVLNRKLAMIFLFSIPILFMSIALITKAAYPLFKSMLEKYDKLNSIVQENLIAIRVVKTFVREGFESEKFEKAASDVRAAQVKAERLVVRLMPIMRLVVYSTMIAALWFGGNMIVAVDMKTGELVSFLSYITQILMSLMMLGMIFVSIVSSRASVSRILEVLDEESDIKSFDVTAGSAASGVVKKVVDGSIDFYDVCFSYNKTKETLVLDKINLHIKSGQTVGIIGGTGSSKSTLVSLIPRLYDVFSGSVKVGGVDVRDYDLEELREAVAVVLQKNVLFKGTIRENLWWGNKNATEEQMIAACKIADAHEFISRFTDGYDTELGQGGVNISGGQKQRLCIARAILKNPKVLILDDSTSAVDTATEARIQAALRSSYSDVTKIIIAQRISSVKDADLIVVMDDGKINGTGTHQELLSSNEIYRQVYDSQQSLGDADI